MPIIYQLLRSLSPPEVQRIADLPIQDRERDVLTVMMQIHNKIFPSSTICKKLGIQTSHLDKINSILFKRAIEELSGKDVYKQVQYLDQKSNMWNVSKRVLNFYEQKTIKHSNDKAEKFRFYSFYFQWLITIPSSLRSGEELKKLEKKILDNCPAEKYDETSLWIDITELRKEINIVISKAAFNQLPVQQSIYEKIDRLIQRAADIGSTQNQYKARLAGIVFYNLTKEFSRSKQFIAEINELTHQHPEIFSENDKLVAQWHHAQVLFFSSSFEQSFELYKSIIEKINLNELAKWYILVAEFFQLCIITRHYAIASDLIEKYFSKFFNDHNANFYLSSLIQYCKLLIHTGAWESAKTQLDLLHKNTSKTASLQFQFALRELTVSWYYLTGKYDRAIIIAEKNLKYMRSKKIHHLIPEYTYHSRLVKSLVRYKTKKIALSQDDYKMLRAMQEGSMAQYGMLLNKLLEK